jgi:Ras-related protein Rab-6A
MWDAAVHEMFRSVTNSYLRDSHIALVCFDSTRDDGPSSVPVWVDRVKGLASDCKVILVGTKIDALSEDAQERVRSKSEELKEQYKSESFLTSAQSGEGIDELLEYLGTLANEIVVKPPPQGRRRH